MSEPCTEKVNIEKLFDFHDEKMSKLHTLELRQVEIQEDVRTIKSKAALLDDVKIIKAKIENGLTAKVDRTHDVMLRLEPVIEHHGRVINNIEQLGWWISRIMLAVVIGMVFWAASKGYIAHV